MIQDRIKRPLADELLFGKLAKGGKVYVTVADDKLAFHIVPVGDTLLLDRAGRNLGRGRGSGARAGRVGRRAGDGR